MTARDIVIFGCGGFGREVLQIIEDLNAAAADPVWRMRGFLVSPGYASQGLVHGHPVHDDIHAFGPPRSLALAIGIGNPAARQRVVADLTAAGVRDFPALVHPQAWCGRRITLGEGVVICAGALLTTDIALGPHVHVNLSATIGHDAVVGEFSTLGPGVHLSGKVTLGTGVEIGTGASVVPGVTIGEGAVIGAGAAVIRDVQAGSTAVGVPARVISTRPVSS